MAGINYKVLLTVLAIFAGTSAFALDAVLNPLSDWVVAESRNFVFITEEELQSSLPELALDCEQAYSELGPILEWRFQEKVTVLYSDRTDRHEGWASSLPRTTLFITAAPSREGSFLGGPGDHRRRTIYHELTHLLLTDANYGFISQCNRVFGRVIPDLMDPLSLLIAVACLPPANAAPSWFLEGMSVWAETRFVGPGRGRSTEVDAAFRVAADQNRLLPPIRWHLRAPDWPFGHVPYLYGMKAMEESARFPGRVMNPDHPARLAHAVASAPVAGFFNSQAFDVQDRDFETITQHAWSREKKFQSNRISSLKSKPLTETPRWSPLKVQIGSPVWSRDDDLWVSAQFEDRKSRLARVDMATRTVRNNGPRITPGWTRTTTDPQTGEIYFTRLDGCSGEEWRSRLYRFNPSTGVSKRVRDLDRTVDAGASNGGKLAVVRRLSSGDILELYQWDSAQRQALTKISVVYGPVEDSTLSSPVFTRDGNTLFFIVTEPGGSRIIQWPGQGGKGPRTVWATEKSIRSLDLARGTDLLLCSDFSGVFNVYMLDSVSGQPVALTNTIGGITAARLNSDGKKLAAVALDADGCHVTVLPMNDLKPSGEQPVMLSDPWSFPGDTSNRWNTPVPLTRVTSYDPLRELRFDYWTPWLDVFFNYTAGGAAARWSDRSMAHRVFMYAGVESLQNEAIGSIQWEYAEYRPQWKVYLSRKAPIYNGLMQDTAGRWYDYEETLWDLTTSAQWKWDYVAWHAEVETGWQLLSRSGKDADLWRRAVEQGLFAREPLISGEESTFWMTALINTATAYPRSLSLEDGWFLKLSADWTDRILGSDLDRQRFRTDATAWLQIPGLKNHVVKISAAYGSAHGDRTAQGAFTVSGYDDLGPGNPPGFESALILRGYPGNVQSGDRAAAMNLAFRFPIVQRFQSFSSRSIVYITQLTGELFWETAAAWNSDDTSKKDWFRSYGFEANVGTIWFSSIDLAPGAGVCWMPDYRSKTSGDSLENGDWAAYFSLKTTIAF